MLTRSKKIFIENKDLLQDFLANMLDIPAKDIMDIEIKKNPYLHSVALFA